MLREIEGHDLASTILLAGPATYAVHVTSSLPGPARGSLSILVDGVEAERTDVDAPVGSVWPLCSDALVHLARPGVLTFRAPRGLVMPHFRVLEIPRAGGAPDDGLRRCA